MALFASAPSTLGMKGMDPLAPPNFDANSHAGETVEPFGQGNLAP